ncbi:MAG: DNA mismatch repair endonuclease MutL, partial [Bacteroidota bacterium]
GCGMSETDARMSFERHATSKIRSAQDLFSIRTMGFRGEALASIAALAQVEMKTRQQKNEMGARLQLEGSKVIKSEPCQAPTGTSLAVKNIFFNVPARRNFLKSNAVELKHIMDEFHRVALANPDIQFSLHRDGEQIFQLMSGNLRQRIVGLLGSHSNKKLIPVEEDTDIVQIRGFVGKPEFAKKTRGDQYFFVNDRFIKSGYLHHAVMTAYDELINKENYPTYFLFIDIDPAKIDINVHPTKQEIKFDDERLVYNYLRVAVRHALGQHNVMPSLDFEQESTFNLPVIGRSSTPTSLGASQAFKETPKESSGSGGGSWSNFQKPSQREKVNLANWQEVYAALANDNDEQEQEQEDQHSAGTPLTLESNWSDEPTPKNQKAKEKQGGKAPYQIHRRYILNQIKSGFILIDQQAAHERILYEQYLEILQEQTGVTQPQLFSQTIELNAQDSTILEGIREQVNQLGFDIQPFGQQSFIINGIPAEMVGRQDAQETLLQLIEQYKLGIDLKLDIKENIARAMARSASIKKGQSLEVEEMRNLIDKLFACAIPYKSPTGRNCFHTFELEEIAKLFES